MLDVGCWMLLLVWLDVNDFLVSGSDSDSVRDGDNLDLLWFALTISCSAEFRCSFHNENCHKGILKLSKDLNLLGVES